MAPTGVYYDFRSIHCWGVLLLLVDGMLVHCRLGFSGFPNRLLNQIVGGEGLYKSKVNSARMLTKRITPSGDENECTGIYPRPVSSTGKSSLCLRQMALVQAAKSLLTARAYCLGLKLCSKRSMRSTSCYSPAAHVELLCMQQCDTLKWWQVVRVFLGVLWTGS